MTSFLIQLLILAPVLTLAHELGHALVGLARTDGLVSVVIGTPPARWQARRGRFVLGLNPTTVFGAVGGAAGTYQRMAPRDRLAYVLAGPFVQAAAALVIVMVGVDLHARNTVFVGCIGVGMALMNLVPWKLKSGLRSDGANAAAAWRELHGRSTTSVSAPLSGSFEAELEATAARWLVHFTDKSHLTELRAKAIEAAPAWIGLKPGDRNPDALAACKLAWAGWCWREAEHGDPRRLREAVLDAVQRATSTGAVEPGLTVMAATYLVTSGVHFGLASPGSDDETRTRFFMNSLSKLPANVRPQSLPVEKQGKAFLFGVALHDIETARAL